MLLVCSKSSLCTAMACSDVDVKCSVRCVKSAVIRVLLHRLRKMCEKTKQRYFPELKSDNHKRCEFLPVEWRSKLKLDGGKK